jgi:RimJ/RimL family protein N-acetyltransferase
LIETARLRLRPWLREDRPAFEALVNTPQMMARLGGLKSPAGIDAMFEKRLNDQAKHGFTYWAAELRDTGELIGSCGIRIASNYPDAPIAGMPEIGWRVSDAHWGKGFAREAAEASIAWGWANLDTPAIGAWTTIANTRSWGLMERLGMQRRPDLDFRLKDHAPEDPVGAMIVYTLERP